MLKRKTILDWKEKHNIWEERICAELDFLIQAFWSNGQEIPAQIQSCLEQMYELSQHQMLTEQQVLDAEKQLAAYAGLAKKYEVFCVAHAHIDMNWMWGMPETVGIVIDTFQTMLNLMDEYPDFIFSQSQASTYRIIEQYAPSLLPQIRKRVQEGRWEVTASTWVENDKNMSGSESQVRHYLYTKKYLHDLLNVDADSLCLDFEPDTFGHSAHLPEILQKAGVRYYFHCRGNDREEAYRWRAPSGAEVLCYREPNWYLGPIRYSGFSFVPGFCSRNHTNAAVVVYGVGDHGGGPTRRDLDRIQEMRSWPLFPNIHFARLTDFYHKLAENMSEYPVVERELNCVFTGCYTTQSRIKHANRRLEDALYDSEAICAMQKLAGTPNVPYAPFDKAWETTLFNQFHDILPGSCVPDTVSFALGKSQEALSYSIANANRAMKALGDAIDTSVYGCSNRKEDTAEGAGCGYNTMHSAAEGAQAASSGWKVTETCRGGGTLRAYTVFNTTQYARKEVITVTVWDWTIPLQETALFDGSGNQIAFSIAEQDQEYWQHHFDKISFLADVPAFGYSNYYLRQSEDDVQVIKPDEPRVHRMEDGSVVLENALIRAEFSTETMKLLSLKNKESNVEMIAPNCPSGYFRMALEQTSEDYSAWVIGEYRKLDDLNQNYVVNVLEESLQGLRKFIKYRIAFASSSITVTVSLDDNSRMLRYSIHADWRELGAMDRADHATPQLQFCMPVGYEIAQALCDVPGGPVLRETVRHDVPVLSYGAGLNQHADDCVMLTSDCKYGYRFEKTKMQITLVRSSFAPDRFPDFGEHQWEIGVGVMQKRDAASMQKEAIRFSHPLYAYSNGIHGGMQEQRKSFITVKDAVVQAMKIGEDAQSVILRIRNDNDQPVQALVHMPETASAANLVNLFESNLGEICAEKCETATEIAPHSFCTMQITC